ncbi:MAG TPA: glycosyltransferase [Candidatus Bathyarchaeia archaeon]|nr:glycosyltransferase [Candidatus Bathyarchaeia archaeon]
MTLVITALACLVGFMILGLYASLAVSVHHFRPERAGRGEPLLPMTLIKPVRGMDHGMRDNFEAMVESDPERALQIIIAVESDADPAAAVARGFAASHPDRDILVLLTGPAHGRTGKAHNMIEALARARHARVIFSDADIRTTPGLLHGTSRAFRDGYEAVFGVPYHVYVPDLGGWMFRVAFNHNFSIAAALCHHLGLFRFASGAWMAYTREVLERAGGLEPFAHHIADDFAISDRVRRIGARQYLLHELVPVSETGTTVREAFWHLVKWCRISHASVPGIYFGLAVLNPGLIAVTLWLLCEMTRDRPWLGRGLLATFLVSRALAAFLQDRLAARVRLPLWEYGSLVVIDLGYLLFWAFGLRRRIVWRGVRYRLRAGGIAEVLE